MPSVAEELAALRKQSLAKTHGSKLKDAKGLSTPEQEAQQMKDLNEKNRTANYSKQAKTDLAAGGSKVVVDQDLELRMKLAAQKKQDKAAANAAKQTLAAGTKAVDKTLEFQQQSKAFKNADKEKQKQATENLQSYNTAKLNKPTAATAAAANNKTEDPPPPVQAPVMDIDDPVEQEGKNMPELDEIDDIPTLEEMPDPTVATVAEDGGGTMMPDMGQLQPDDDDSRVLNRAEKKARKMMERLQMRPISGITRVTLKSAGNQGFFTIHKPDIYEKNGSYVVFGEARQGTGITQQQQEQQAQQQKQAAQGLAAIPAATSAADTPEIISDDGDAIEVDESGVDAKDIELVIQQAGCSRARAVTALKENDGDLVCTFLRLSRRSRNARLSSSFVFVSR